MDLKVISTIESKKNNNLYEIMEDRIRVKDSSGTKEVFLPEDSQYSLCFYDIFYMGEKLYVIVARRVGFDVKYEIDEDELILRNPTPFK